MFTRNNTRNGYMYRVNRTEERVQCADWAKKTAIAKANHTADTWQRRPNKYAKFVDIYYGDYAKNLVKAFLLANNPNLEIVEYDLIRTDDFHNHDLFDLRIDDSTIEVKSSLEKYTFDVNGIYDGRRIIVNVNGPHETLSDFVVQVFFVPSNLRHYEEIEEDNKLNPNITEEEADEKCEAEVVYSLNNTDVYIAGWINRDQEINAIEAARQNNGFGVRNNNVNALYRTYANVLIKDSNAMDKLIEVLTNLQQNNR